MFTHPDLMLDLVKDRHRELVQEADRGRLLAIARSARRSRKSRAARGHPTGTLASCGPSGVVPAR